ncbi:hypothetical protein QTP86_011419 [Hemibagrus guttatus]|nr:hypothetical protein QTP86_011419 [Hemibagrus guttatus]
MSVVVNPGLNRSGPAALMFLEEDCMETLVGALHTEEIYLLVLEDSTADIVLGHPWLEQHDPILSWKTGEIMKWGEQCFRGCFPNLPIPESPCLHEVPVHATSVESPLETHTMKIPACYSHFQDVFCPRKASNLPPHRPWDCAIGLIPGEPVPKGRIYSLSIPEEKAMEEYIKEALSQGYIHPSTSPAVSSFFFVAKKDGGLRPCIDYRARNKITVKFRYPLPLVPSALERLGGATVFTKLSRLHSRDETCDEPESILPEKLFASPISWSEETLPEPSAPTNVPTGCPHGLQFIPRAQRTALIHSTHTSLGTGHPGINGTLSLLKQRFWWPNMVTDVRR